MGTLSKSYQDAYNEIQNMVEEAITKSTIPLLLKYSAYEWGDSDIPINNLKEVPIKGKVKFFDEGSGEIRYESEVMDSPTWLEIAVAANMMLHVTCEKFATHLDELEVFEVDEDGVKYITLIMGYSE